MRAHQPFAARAHEHTRKKNKKGTPQNALLHTHLEVGRRAEREAQRADDAGAVLALAHDLAEALARAADARRDERPAVRAKAVLVAHRAVGAVGALHLLGALFVLILGVWGRKGVSFCLARPPLPRKQASQRIRAHQRVLVAAARWARARVLVLAALVAAPDAAGDGAVG